MLSGGLVSRVRCLLHEVEIMRFMNVYQWCDEEEQQERSKDRSAVRCTAVRRDTHSFFFVSTSMTAGLYESVAVEEQTIPQSWRPDYFWIPIGLDLDHFF